LSSAGINSAAPAALLLGIGLLALGCAAALPGGWRFTGRDLQNSLLDPIDGAPGGHLGRG